MLLLAVATGDIRAINLLRSHKEIGAVAIALDILEPQAEKLIAALEKNGTLASFEAQQMRAWQRGDVPRPEWLSDEELLEIP